MQAHILKQSRENIWDKFVEANPLGTIHQTAAWGHFQEGVSGRGKYWIVVLEDSSQNYASNSKNNSQIVGGTLLIRHQLPKNHCWLYAPRGPLLNYNSDVAQNEMDLLLSEIKKIAKQENAIFLRIDPPLSEESKISQDVFKNFHPTKFGFQPEHTLIIDLTKSEEEILNQMKPKGRYNIRLAEKKGVKIFKSENPQKDIGEFYKLLCQTTNRDKFSGHNQEFYLNMLKTLSSHVALYLATYDKQILAAVIVTYFKDTATYYYGASGNEYRNLMAPYLLHWKIMRDAKASGFKFYDLFGIAPENAKNHPWRGVTEFKRKFGGQEVSYRRAREYSFSKWKHWMYKIYKRFK